MTLILCAALMLAPTASFAESPASASAPAATFSLAGFDGDDATHDWNTNKFFQTMTARTGVSFTFAQYTNYEKWQAAKTAMFAGGDMPDVLFKAELSSAEQIRLHEEGKLIDLKPLLAENAPNLWALLTAHPDWLAAITLPDGAIVALPGINEMSAQNGMWINQKWLEALKLDKPTDKESLQKVLAAFKTGDPNRNGKSDEIPFLFLGAFDLKFLLHAFGITANDYNVYLDESGAVRYAPLDARYAEGIQWLRELYKDGLLHKDGFTTADTLRTVTDEKSDVTYGIVMGATPMALLPLALAEQYTLLAPLSCDGKQTYRDFMGPLTRGTFAITSACESPETLLQWVDLLYTEEGARLAMAGVEGEEYAVDEDGMWNWVSEDQSTLSAILTDAIISDTGSMPWLEPVDFQLHYAQESARRMIEESQAFMQYVKRPFPYVTLTAAQEQKALEMQNVLGLYVDVMFARFVLGEIEPTAENLAAFQSELRAKGADEFVAFWQDIVDGK